MTPPPKTVTSYRKFEAIAKALLSFENIEVVRSVIHFVVVQIGYDTTRGCSTNLNKQTNKILTVQVSLAIRRVYIPNEYQTVYTKTTI